MANATMKNGRTRQQSRTVSRPCCHQRNTSKATGNVMPMDLQSSPAANSTKAKKHHDHRGALASNARNQASAVQK